jgi:hypothetical protein
LPLPAVEYRLLQHAPVPGALQDAAAVYANLVINVLGAKKGADGKYYLPESSSPLPHNKLQHVPQSTLTRAETHAQETGQRPDPVPLTSSQQETSQSGGGNSTASSSTTTSTPGTGTVKPMLSGTDAVPQIVGDTSSDTSLSATATTTAGNSPYPESKLPKGKNRTKIILIGDSAGGNLVLALARWVRDEGILPPPDGLLLLSVRHNHPQYFLNLLKKTAAIL